VGIVLGLLGIVALLGLVYWLIVIAEASYFGPAAVRFIYQRGASFYDEAREPVIATDERVLLPWFRHLLDDSGEHQVLDVATGTARIPLLLADQFWFRGHIHALDLTPAMLERAQAKIDAAQLGHRITLYEGNADRLPWLDEQFDLVVSLEALEFFPSARRALAEMVRVMRPGAHLMISKYPDPWARLLPRKGLTRAAITKELQRLGLESVAIYDWQKGYYELVFASKPLASESLRFPIAPE
jgi:ubiquinone/menaquinone biosynthesis C-methylase UbiE